MIPIIYDAQATNLGTNGIGRLSECTSCLVTEERNGDYTLELRYPVTGKLFPYLTVDAIIGAKPNRETEVDHFRIISIYAESMNTVVVTARQVALEAMRNNVYLGIVYAGLRPTEYTNLADEADYLWNNTTTLAAGIGYPGTYPSITFSGDAYAPAGASTTPSGMSIPFNRVVCGIEGSLIDRFGGELKYQDYTVSILAARGSNNGTRLAYGKNITGIQQTSDFSETYDGFIPYVTISDPYEINEPVAIGDPTDPKEPIVWSQYKGLYAHSRVLPLDVNSIIVSDSNGNINWSSTYTASVAYVAQHPEWSLPDVTTTVQFVPLGQTEEYRHLAEFESLDLCDTVQVYFPSLGVNKSAKVVKAVYNTLREKYDSLEIGTLKQTLAQTIKSIKKGR